jgi:drug/metabolite transporter (DMT)-like permease
VLRPNLAHLGPVALLPLVAALGLAFLVILNRKSLGTAGVLAMQFWVVAMATPILLIATTLGHLSGIPRLHVGAPTPIILFKCACIAVIGTVAHWLIYIATERASAPVVAPMIYFQLLIAGTLGWLVFGHGVDLVAAVGMAVIILAGLLLWRSQRNPLVVIPPD